MIPKLSVCFQVMASLAIIIGAIQTTQFSCRDRPSGYYADTSAGCEVYHMCDGLGRKFSYRCPNDTLFQQRMLICDHWYMVNCSRAEEDYSANLLIGQRNTPFVKDYQRTPRPDLADLSNPVNLQNYREREKRKRIEDSPIENIVGEVDNGISSDESKYFPPRRWSIKDRDSVDLSKSINSLANNRKSQTGQSFFKTSYNTVNRFKNNYSGVSSNDRFDSDISRDDQPRSNNNKVNFPSSFKGTTPVYPKELIGVDLAKFYGTDEVLPRGDKFEGTVFKDNNEFFKQKQPAGDQGNRNFKVNFPSNFKATTPVYPKEVVGVDLKKFYESGDQSSSGENNYNNNDHEENVVVNFQSNYKGTTPVYPKEVIGVDLNKFSGSEEEPPAPESVRPIVNFQSNFKGTTPVYPKEVIGIDLNKFSGDEEEAPAFDDAPFQPSAVHSNFKGTTPVYPDAVDPTSPRPDEASLLPPHLKRIPSSENGQEFQNNDVVVNFGSNFKGTTPVYPHFVEATSPNPDEFGLLPPKKETQGRINRQQIAGDSDTSTFSRRSFRKPNKLDIILEGEDIEESVLKNTFNSKQLTEYMLSMNPEELKELRGHWHIPDYDFPLETVQRPSYETVFSSYKSDGNAKLNR